MSRYTTKLKILNGEPRIMMCFVVSAGPCPPHPPWSSGLVWGGGGLGLWTDVYHVPWFRNVLQFHVMGGYVSKCVAYHTNINFQKFEHAFEMLLDMLNQMCKTC